MINDIPIQSRARASLPFSCLSIQPISTNLNSKETTFGVLSRKNFPQRTQFGPAEGAIKEYDSNNYINQSNLII